MRKALLLVCMLVAGFISNLYSQPLTGTIRIGGSNADYTTIAAALQDLKIRGGNNITLQLSGTFNETLKIHYPEYEYIASPLIIKGGTIISSDPLETVFLGDHAIIIEEVKIINTSPTGSALHLAAAGFSTVRNCQLQSIGGSGLKLSDDTFDVSIEYNTISGGEYGIYIESSTNLTINNNYIEDFKRAGIYATIFPNDVDHDGYNIVRNQISSSSNWSNLCGIWIDGDIYSNVIDRNEIWLRNVLNRSVSYGIRTTGEVEAIIKLNYITADNPINMESSGTITNNTLRSFSINGVGLYMDASSSYRRSQIINNEIVSYYGDCIRIAGGGHNIVNNSTFLYETATSGTCLSVRYGSVTVNNCSFYNNSRNPLTSAISVSSQGSINSDYNNLYSLSGVLGSYGLTTCSTFTSWKNITGKDRNSISADPEYMDPELGSTQIFTTSPLVGRALASVMPADDRSSVLRQYNAIGAWDPSQPYWRSKEFNLEKSENSEKTEIIVNDAGIVTVNSGITGEMQVRITNIANQNTIINQKIVFTSEISQQIIDISEYPSGYYVINLSGDKESVTKKFYKK